MIKQILIFSRDQKLEKSSINLNSTVKNAIKLVKGFIPKTISIEIDIKGDENIFFGNSIHFHQIILNLITNAQQAMTTGHGIIKVSLTNIKINEISPKTYSTFTKKNYYCLIVSDTGEGMPEHIVDHIFDPFFTTKNEGTGLGLSTIYGIVKNYNGYIDVESHLHEGTTFKLYFPIEKPIKNDKAKSIESNKFIKSKKPHYTIPSKLAHFSSNFVNKSLIMIDDEKSNTLFMRKVCSQYKIDAQFYDNSMECYKKVFENVIKKPDLIITDFNMPLMNGIEFATLVKKKHPSIPIIMISGSEYNIPKIDELDGLFHKLLFKPVDQETLITCIADIFN